MRLTSILACSIPFLFTSVTALGQASTPKITPPKPTAKAAQAKPKSLLPEAFAGWVSDDAPRLFTDPSQADQTPTNATQANSTQTNSANAAALKEYDFTDGAIEVYKRSGETLTVKALRFTDASGAYGAYSFYRQNGWPKEEVGSGATSDHNRVLFWVGNTLVDATFSHIGPMSGSELRDLAGQIPVPDGTKALTPPILANLPKDSLEAQTTHYALGPAGYAGSGGVLPPDLVGFDRGAETVTANYALRSNPATLTLIDYPTPQLAAAQETKIRAYLKAGSQAQLPWPKPLQDSDTASLEVRRSGPLVIVVSGDAVPEESHKLLETVHYDADITSMAEPAGKETEIAKTAKLLLGIAGLVIVGVSAALLLGFFLGGGRALYRIARGKPVSSVYEAEFIRINLHEDWVESVPGPVPSSTPSIDRPNPKR